MDYRPTVEVVKEWLDLNVKTLRGNIHANALLQLAKHVDSLDEEEMSRKDYDTALRGTLKAIDEKQAKLLMEVESSAVSGVRSFTASSLSWLGMVPVAALSESLRGDVLAELKQVHGVDVEEVSDDRAS